MNHAKMKMLISQEFPEGEIEETHDMPSVTIGKPAFLKLMKYLKSDSRLQFDYLTDVTAVDYLRQERQPRFDLVYHLYSFKNNVRLRVKMGVAEEDMDVPSLSALWKAANWLEREAYDMFGFHFTGHPDLRRILTPDMFDGHPLRKDYPLRGRGERDVILDLK